MKKYFEPDVTVIKFTLNDVLSSSKPTTTQRILDDDDPNNNNWYLPWL